MQIGIQTWGTEGDIRPFIALAGGLSKAGHDVSLALTNIEDKDYSLTAHRLGFTVIHVATPVIKDKDRLDAIGRLCLEKKKPIEQFRVIAEKLFEPAVKEMYEVSQTLCQKNDVVIGHFLHYPLYVAAEKFRVPKINVILAHNVIPSKYTSPHGIPNLGKLINPFWWWLLKSILNKNLLDTVNKLLTKEYLPTVNDILTQVWTSKNLNLIAVSPVFCQRQNDWNENQQVCGFLNLPETDCLDWTMPSDLKDFLEMGAPPLFITFGSLMPNTQKENKEIMEIFNESVELANCRAIIQVKKTDTISDFQVNKNIYYSPPIPHKMIFPKCFAVVHHGGAGTTQTSTLAGVPSIVVAHTDEQSFWGDELSRLGLAPHTLKRRNLTVQSLAQEMQIVLNSPEMKERAKNTGKALQKENGVDKAIEMIDTKLQSIITY